MERCPVTLIYCPFTKREGDAPKPEDTSCFSLCAVYSYLGIKN